MKNGGGHFAPKLGGHFELESGGHFKLELGGQYHWNLQDSNEQKKYLKLLRAQLSNHEQLLLYYNSLTNFGKGWIDNEYFTTYEMIKNIPLKLADFGLKPKEYLKDKKGFDDTIFEWDEL